MQHGSCWVHWCMTLLLVAWWYVRAVLPTSGCTFIGHLFWWPTVLEEGALLCLTRFSLMALTWVLAMHGFLDFLDTGRDIQEHFCLGDSHCAHPGNAGPPDPNERKYGILVAAEEVVRAGVLSYAPGSESEHVSPVSPFIDWSCVVGWCLVVGGVLFAVVWFFSIRDQSVRSSYQPMTSLA